LFWSSWHQIHPEALISTSRFRINLELYSTTPLSNMATPPTYAILIQHPHVIYDVLLTLIIGVFLRPRDEPGVIWVTGQRASIDLIDDRQEQETLPYYDTKGGGRDRDLRVEVDAKAGLKTGYFGERS
jgi:hypothetical protein